MSRKHYIQFAAMMAARRPAVYPEYESDPRYIFWAIICNDLCNILAADNPTFDRARFLAACNRGAA